MEVYAWDGQGGSGADYWKDKGRVVSGRLGNTIARTQAVFTKYHVRWREGGLKMWYALAGHPQLTYFFPCNMCPPSSPDSRSPAEVFLGSHDLELFVSLPNEVVQMLSYQLRRPLHNVLTMFRHTHVLELHTLR